MIPQKINKILCPVDLSPFSLPVIDYAKRMSRHIEGSKIYLLHVIKDPLDPIYKCEVEKDKVFECVEKKVHEMLQQIDEADEKMRERIKTIVKIGDPTNKILDFADKEHMDLIVMSTHGRTGMSRVLMGSIAENIVRKGKVPVMMCNKQSLMVKE